MPICKMCVSNVLSGTKANKENNEQAGLDLV